MQEKKFEEINAGRWRQFDALLTAAEKNSKGVDLSQLPELLQKQSADLSLARHRMYAANMVEYLNAQVIRGFKLVQKGEHGIGAKLLRFFSTDFPRAVRKEWRLHLVCWLVCLLPAFTIIAFSNENNLEWVNSVMDQSAQEGIDSSYGKGESQIENGRGDGGDMFMFGYYIWNNISIDFQIFASGILGGIGSLYYLFYNALQFGAVVAYVEANGDPMKLYGFVSSHAPYELWAMLISGMAGMRVGFSILMPGRRSRTASLMQAGKTAIPLILGAASMTFLAACIEGFWSANPMHFLGGAQFKIWVGLAGWLALLLYFMLGGRRATDET